MEGKCTDVVNKVSEAGVIVDETQAKVSEVAGRAWILHSRTLKYDVGKVGARRSLNASC